MDSTRRSISAPTSTSAAGAARRAQQAVGSPILERPISKTRGEISHSAFAFLFSEIVQYAYNRVSSIEDLQTRLQELGFGVGQRMIEMIGCRERLTKRETRILGILQVSNLCVSRPSSYTIWSCNPLLYLSLLRLLSGAICSESRRRRWKERWTTRMNVRTYTLSEVLLMIG